MSSTLIDGLWVEDTGTGDDVILCIHGLGGSSNFWSPLMGSLDGKRVIRPDLRGAGRSDSLEGEVSIQSHVDQLVEVLNHLKIESAHLVAHSMGTIIAQHLTAQHRERVRSLALFGPLTEPAEANREPTRARAGVARTGPAGMQEIADAICNAATSNETKSERFVSLAAVRELIMRQPAEGYARNCEALAAAQAVSVSAISVPVLLVTGEEDRVATPAGMQALAAEFKDSRQFILAGCGHWTVFEKPFECARVLADFYKN